MTAINHGPARNPYNYDTAPTGPVSTTGRHEAKQISRRNKMIAAGAGVALLAAGIGAGLALGGGGEKAPAGSRPAATAEPIPGDTNGDGRVTKDDLHKMSPSAVAEEVGPSSLLGVYGSDFDSWRSETYDMLVKKGVFTADESSVISVPTGPKEQYSDQDIINQVTLDIADASIQDDLVDGQRMLPLPLSKDSNEFPIAVGMIGPGKGVVIGSSRVVGESLPHIPGGQEIFFNGVDLTNYSEARVIHVQTLPNGPDQESLDEYHLYGLIKNGQNEEWQLLQRSSATDVSTRVAVGKLLTANGRQPS